MANNMILHCGGYKAERDDVAAVVTPPATGSHFPLDHMRMIDETIGACEEAGLEIVTANHALVDKPLKGEHGDGSAYRGARYFGLLDVRPKNGWDPDNDHGLAIGMRNTHDKSFAASLVAGTRVFVCDNLGFNGEVMLSRLHTRFIARDLPRLVTDAFSKIIEHNANVEKQITVFKESDVDNVFVHDVVCKALRSQAMPNAAVTKVLGQWYDPAYDEFTSVVDRTVAQIGCAAIRKSLARSKARLVAVTCHYDILEWLEPDWVIEMPAGQLSRRRLRRPVIQLDVRRCHRDMWEIFRHHHYLDTSSSTGALARCYVALLKGRPVAFTALRSLIALNKWRLTRTVVLPDFQGVGIGQQLTAFVGHLYRREGLRVYTRMSHPAMIAHRKRSPLWRVTSVSKSGNKPAGIYAENNSRGSLGRSTVSFEFVGGEDRT